MESPRLPNHESQENLVRNAFNLLSVTKVEDKSNLFVFRDTIGPYMKLVISHKQEVNTLTNGKLLLPLIHKLELERFISGFSLLEGQTTFILDNYTVIIEQIKS